MSAAAAFVANKRKTERGENSSVDRRKRLSKKLHEDHNTAGELFDELDSDCSGSISQAQLKELLTKLNSGKEPSPQAWSFALGELQRVQKTPSLPPTPSGPQPPTSPPPSAPPPPTGQPSADSAAAAGAEDSAALLEHQADAITAAGTSEVMYSRSAVLSVVARCRYYLSHTADVDTIFKKFDVDGDGMLDHDELKEALQYLEKRDGKRSHGGIIVEVPVTDADVRWVLAQCDVSGNGFIDRNEAIPAMAMWHALADQNFKQQTKCCSIQ